MILGLQQQQTEVGRIRLGVKVATAKGGSRPAKLDKLRFTSARKALIEKIAELYGGTVEPWQPPKGSQQWQVITSATEVPVIIPPQDPSESQWLEMWSAGGCIRRCDGQMEHLSKKPCICAATDALADQRCKMHTRLRVMLEDVPGLGAWRIDTGSYYAGVELPGVAALLAMASGAIPGKLVLDQRTVTRGGKTFNFAVPTLHVEEITPGQLMSGKVQELITARRAAALDGEVRLALTANVDYEALIDAARTVDALRDLYKQASDAGRLTEELKAAFGEKAEEIKAAEAAGEPEVPAEPVLVGELVPAGGWPEVRTPGGVA